MSTDDHPLDKIWDIVIDASDDEDTSGVINYDEGEPGLGRMAVTVQGERYVVEVYKAEEK